MPLTWLSKNARQLWEGGLPRGGRYRQTVESLTSMPILPQLGLDARLAPGRIRAPHVADQLSYFAIDPRPTTCGLTLPAPISSETLAVPLHDGGRLDDDKGSVPTMPEAAQAHPDEPVTVPEQWPPGLPLEHHQLVAKCDVLKREIALTPQRRRHPSPRYVPNPTSTPALIEP